MTKQIEIYIRESGDRTYLNFYIPESIKEHFVAAVESGSFSEEGVNVSLELTAQPKWFTDQDENENARISNQMIHVRIPVDTVNFHFSD